jgi:endonuclease YncB( thermonuclease family)
MESRRAFAVAVLMLTMLAVPAAAQRVIDGDTIDLSGQRWRLWGIDAPELHQLCLDAWPAGVEAARLLERLVVGKRIECEFKGRDRYGRSIGLCRGWSASRGRHGAGRHGLGFHPV